MVIIFHNITILYFLIKQMHIIFILGGGECAPKKKTQLSN